MTVNTNASTGITFGFINANSINSEVLNTIFSNAIDVDRLESDLKFAEKYDFTADQQNENELYSVYLERVSSDMLDFLNSLDNVSEAVEEHDLSLEDYSGSIFVATVDDTTVIYNTDCNTVTVLQSPYIGYFHQCSPVAPNGADLDSPNGTLEAYDVPPAWRELDL